MSRLKATYKEIITISLPLILGNTAWTSNGLFDTIFVGNLGKVQLDAIGFASIFYSVLFMMGFSFTRGTQMLVARRMGELNKHEVGNIVDTTIISMLAVAVVGFGVIKIFSHEILSFMLTNEDIIQKCDKFLSYRIWGLIPSFISFVFIAFYSGIGRTNILAISVAVMTFFNIVLNYGLVYGKFGLPEMGIAGSGTASSISETLAVVVLFGGTFYKRRVHDFLLFRFKKFDVKLLKQMSNIAVPLMLQSTVAVGAWLFLFARIETRLGKDSLAISSIFRQLILFFSIPTWSLGSTANTLISNLVGQQDFAGVKDALRKISIVSLGLAIISCLVIYIFPNFCIGVFTSKEDYALIPMAVHILPVIFVVFILMSFSNIIFNGVISLGDIYMALGIQVAVVVVYVVYFQLMFTMPFVSTFWIWTSEWVYWLAVLAGSLLFFRYKKLEVV
ncbi:MAG TPA: MATE family efflux transporter [Chitinophagales bacterium]|nr:MATE family efflux transporter [Chitinophagales bacterium]